MLREIIIRSKFKSITSRVVEFASEQEMQDYLDEIEGSGNTVVEVKSLKYVNANFDDNLPFPEGVLTDQGRIITSNGEVKVGSRVLTTDEISNLNSLDLKIPNARIYSVWR
jgi:hypothetical protein